MPPASPSPSVRCRPRPLAAAVAMATAAAAAAAAATAVRSVVGSGSAAGTAAAAAAALLAATLAAVAAAVGWPRLATNTLHLHGSVLPTVSGGGRSPLRSAIGDFVAARRAGRLCHLYLRWQASVGAGRNFQAFYFGTRVVTLVCAEDVRHLLVRVDPPRNVAALRHFGTPISPRTLLLLGNGAGEHAAMRRLLAPYLEGPPATAAVLGMLNRELSPGKGGWGGGAPVDDTRSGQGVVSPPGVWTARFDAWAAQGTALDIADVLMDLTLGVIHALIFSSGWAHEGDCAKAKSTLQDYFTLQYLALVPAPAVTAPGPLRTLRDGGAWWVAYVTAAEARRRAGRGVASPPVDLFDIFLADLEKPGGAFGGDWRRMAADVMALMSAGYDTTAYALSWAIYELTCHPDMADRLRAEYAAAFPADGPITAAHLANLPYATAVWHETLRKYPPAPITAQRVLAEDLTLPSDGSVLPAGTAISIPVYLIHHNPTVYPAPDTFDPARWLAAPGVAGRGGRRGADPAALLPFTAGPHTCPGQRASGVEWKVVLGALLLRYDLQAVGGDVELEARTTLRPAGLRVRLRRRG